MENYKLTHGETIIRLSDMAGISINPNNKDYRKYLIWLDEGNTPEEADPLPIPVETYSKLKLIKYLNNNGVLSTFKQFLVDNNVDDYFLYAQDLSSDDEDVQALFPALLQMLSSAKISITEEELKNIIKI